MPVAVVVAVAAVLLAGCDGDPDTIRTPDTTAPATTTTTTAPAPTTTTLPGGAVVAGVCTTLDGATWVERRDAVGVAEPTYAAAGGTAPLVDAVRAACGPALARVEAAADLERRARAALADMDAFRALRVGDGETYEPLVVARCRDAEVDYLFYNPTSEPIGFVIGTSSTVDGPADVAQVDWRLPPRATRTATLPHLGGCGIGLSWFLADDSTVDAAAPGASAPGATGDDPATWLPALVGVDGADWSGTPTQAGRDASLDLRAPRADDTLVASGGDVHPVLAVTVCAGTVTALDPDHVALAYHVQLGPATVDLGAGPEEHPAAAQLIYEAFRRGSDGRWRSLGARIELSGQATAAGCGPVVPHP